MQINSLFEKVPSIIGNFISEIFCIGKNDDIAYKLEYTGSSLKIVSKETYGDFKKYIKKYDGLLEVIESDNSIKKIVNGKTLVFTEIIDDYKIVIISDIDEEKKGSSDKLTLLIADDSPVITKFFTKTFEQEFNILVAKDGEEAIRLITENLNSSLVGAFIDLQMPVKSGYDVLEYLKENNLFGEIPTSVISGEDSSDGIEKATAYGIIDMLQKPFNAEAARSIVNKTIEHSKHKV